ncbi:hypothetical protein B0H12DRAFT_1107249 [Mycena haematopus]|nr:hypothetical protein B0H12DRAFT_1107249 [Mycena haematopus]
MIGFDCSQNWQSLTAAPLELFKRRSELGLLKHPAARWRPGRALRRRIGTVPGLSSNPRHSYYIMPTAAVLSSNFRPTYSSSAHDIHTISTNV